MPSDIRLDRLHDVLQTVMGWSEPRPHVFFQGKQDFHPTGAIPEGGLPEKKYTLSNFVVRSGSVVTKSIPANVLAAGCPCRVIREITEADKIGFIPEMDV